MKPNEISGLFRNTGTMAVNPQLVAVNTSLSTNLKKEKQQTTAAKTSSYHNTKPNAARYQGDHSDLSPECSASSFLTLAHEHISGHSVPHDG